MKVTMKGKGKGMTDKDCPLQFPDLKPVDHTRQCPLYTAVLSRSEEEGVCGDEMDGLQTDLETLLASAGKRLHLLGKETQILNNWQDKKEKKPGGKVQPDPPVTGKRGKGGDDKPNKKFKDFTGKASHPPSGGPGRPKNKNSQVKNQEYDFADSPELTRVPKNDAVNRFWSSVEPYCAEISNEDIKLLEEVLLSLRDDGDYFKVPPLGKHYSERWSQEDIIEEQKEGAKISDKRRNASGGNAVNSNDAANLLKKAESSTNDDSPFGPLTQRLVTALIEENMMTPIEESLADLAGDLMEEASSISPKTLAKQLNIGNPTQLEKRIKRELEEQGILDFEERIEDNPDDEILTELRHKQEELKSINQQNTIITKRLLKLAKEEMEHQKLKKKLSAMDAEVMDAYRKIQSARQKKKAPTKKEKDAVWKILKERNAILKTLEG